MNKRENRFTLVELLLVAGCLIVMGALIGFGCDSSSGSGSESGLKSRRSAVQKASERAHRSSCISNLKQIGTALINYQDENNGQMPNGDMRVDFENGAKITGNKYSRDITGVQNVMNTLRFADYLSYSRVFVCPSSTAAAAKDATTEMKISATDGSLSYAYSYVQGGGPIASAVSGDFTHIGNVDENANHTNYGNLLFFDGHVAGYSGAGWCSKENTGYTEFSDSGMNIYNVLPPNTLRDRETGR